MSIFDYPLDAKTILRKKKSLQRELLARQDVVWHEKRIAILGGSTTAELTNILALFLLNNGIKPTFYESDFNRFYEDALFGCKALDSFQPDIIYIHTTSMNIMNFPLLNDPEAVVDDLFNKEVERFTSIWQALSRFHCPLIQNNFDLFPERSLGNLDSYDIHGKSHFIQRLNLAFAQKAREIDGLHLNDIHYLSASLGLQQWFDKNLYYSAKYAMSFAAIPPLAQNLSKIINAILGKSKKCLVLDLDNTCWGGSIGEVGVQGIEIGNETAIGEAYLSLQKYIKELNSRGVILAVCSKNDLQNAKQGFTHPDSVLHLEDFTVFKANWNAKDQNMVEIAQEVNINLDSCVFIDDSAVERKWVKSQLSDVCVPDTGSDVIEFVRHLDENGYFETVGLTTEDQNRQHYYLQNKQRSENQGTFANYEEFLKSLAMRAEIKTFCDIYLDRIVQLMNKTNQFNLTTRRYTQTEMAAIIDDSSYIKLYGRLEDKYGDNGLVTLIIGRIVDAVCHIDLWLMSCRVIKRNLEHAMLDELIKHCLILGVKEIIGYYLPTAKNNLVANLYLEFGFACLEENPEKSVWRISPLTYKTQNRVIKVNDD